MTNENDGPDPCPEAVTEYIKSEGVTAADIIRLFNDTLKDATTPEDKFFHQVCMMLLEKIAADGVPPERIMEELERRLQEGSARLMDHAMKKFGNDQGN